MRTRKKKTAFESRFLELYPEFMAQAEEVMSPIKTAITRARGPLFKFLTEGSLQNTTGSKANRVKLASTKKEFKIS